MKLHLIVAGHVLLQPWPLPPESLAALAGDSAVAPTAYWLSPRCGRYDHDFLTVDRADGRIATFATALRENFGAHFEPVLILTGLARAAGAHGHGPGTAALEVVLDLWNAGVADRLALLAVSLDKSVDPDGLLTQAGAASAEPLARRLAALGIPAEAVEIGATRLDPSGEPGRHALLNALSWRIADELPWAFRCDRSLVAAKAVRRVLAGVDEIGFAVPTPLRADVLPRIAETVATAIALRMAEAPPQKERSR